MQYDRELVLNILERIQSSIEQIVERSKNYHCGDDFLLTPTGVTILDSICMQFIAIGESLKGLDKITNGTLLVTHPEIDWKHVKGLRDIIAHHYFDIDADQIWWIIEKELPSLKEAITSMKKETSNIIISDKIKVLSNVEPTKSHADYKDDIMDTLSGKY